MNDFAVTNSLHINDIMMYRPVSEYINNGAEYVFDFPGGMDLVILPQHTAPASLRNVRDGSCPIPV